MNLELAVYVLWGLSILVAGFFVYLAWQKSKILSTCDIQCSSGDSEVMMFKYNFLRGESEESKASKVNEAFAFIEDRRDENHAKYLEVKAAAIKENEEKVENGEDLKLRSITEKRGT